MTNPIHLWTGLLKRSGTCGLDINRDSKGMVIPVCIDGTDATLLISHRDIIGQRAQ